MRLSHLSQTKLGRMFGVHGTCIGRILGGQQWNHVTGLPSRSRTAKSGQDRISDASSPDIAMNAALNTQRHIIDDDLNTCPDCGGPTTHDREYPPNPYRCGNCCDCTEGRREWIIGTTEADLHLLDTCVNCGAVRESAEQEQTDSRD